MIYILPRDGLTRPLMQSDSVPGEDLLTYVEVDTEEDIRTNLAPAMNAAMQEWSPDLTVRPWPWKMPQQAWFDYSMRYENFAFELRQWDYPTDTFALLPAGQATVLRYPDQTLRVQQRVTRKRNRADMQGLGPADFATVTRLDTRNEAGGTAMREEACLIFHGQQDSRYVPVVPDNDLITPFDLTHPERYTAFDSAGRAVPVKSFCDVKDGTLVELILRPRRWRWIVELIAHFEYDDWWGSSPSDEYFVSAFYLRPPFYPYRYNESNANPAEWFFPDSFGNLVGYDIGIDMGWDGCWHSRDLRLQIHQQQWYSMCEVYTFEFNDPPTVSVQAYPPRIGEIVCGIANVDRASGAKDVVWLMQAVDASLTYPQHTVGMFYSNWEA